MKAPDLYMQFQGGIIKISQCVSILIKRHNCYKYTCQGIATWMAFQWISDKMFGCQIRISTHSIHIIVRNLIKIHFLRELSTIMVEVRGTC